MVFGGSNIPFKPLVNYRARDNIALTANPYDGQLEALAPLFSNNPDFSTPVGRENFTCANAVAGLRLAFALPYTNQQTINFRNAIALWPRRQSQDFFDLLRENSPKALIVLAFY